MMTEYKRYTDFLKDPQFVRWQIMPDDEQEARWTQFEQTNPHLSEEFNRAIRYLKTTGLNNSLLSPLDKEQLITRIRKTIDERERKNRLRTLIRYSAAACIAAVAIISSILLYQSPKKAHTPKDNIVGNLLNSENIQLITGNQTTSFSDDITLSINENGETKVRREGQTEEESFTAGKKQTNTLIVPYGKRSQITFSDGTKVWINAGSELRFPATFTGKTRDIFINGEIYIEVAENAQKPFYVHTPTFSINVYGTSFNVSSYHKMPAEVVLVEGSITLQTTGSKNRTATKLAPGEMVTFNKKGAIEKKKVDISKYTSWKDGYIILSGTPISEALTQIGRIYNLSFNFGENVNLSSRRCTGKLILSENMDDVLNTIALLSGTIYQRNNNKIIIKSKQ